MRSSNTRGNPWHDELGRFCSAEVGAKTITPFVGTENDYDDDDEPIAGEPEYDEWEDDETDTGKAEDDNGSDELEDSEMDGSEEDANAADDDAAEDDSMKDDAEEDGATSSDESDDDAEKNSESNEDESDDDSEDAGSDVDDDDDEEDDTDENVNDDDDDGEPLATIDESGDDTFNEEVATEANGKRIVYGYTPWLGRYIVNSVENWAFKKLDEAFDNYLKNHSGMRMFYDIVMKSSEIDDSLSTLFNVAADEILDRVNLKLDKAIKEKAKTSRFFRWFDEQCEIAEEEKRQQEIAEKWEAVRRGERYSIFDDEEEEYRKKLREAQES